MTISKTENQKLNMFEKNFHRERERSGSAGRHAGRETSRATLLKEVSTWEVRRPVGVRFDVVSIPARATAAVRGGWDRPSLTSLNAFRFYISPLPSF